MIGVRSDRVYRRDASLFNSPGYSGSYHFWTDDQLATGTVDGPGVIRSRCGIVMAPVEFTEREPADVPPACRCRRSGCKQRWPAA